MATGVALGDGDGDGEGEGAAAARIPETTAASTTSIAGNHITLALHGESDRIKIYGVYEFNEHRPS
jgi:hypothetical protein